MKNHITLLLCFCALLGGHPEVVAEETTPTTGQIAEKQEIIRAKIGIELLIDGQSQPAQMFDRVTAGDTCRIYAIPEPDPGYVYVVYLDRGTAMLLNKPESVVVHENSVLALPSLDESYPFDAESPEFAITIICSAVRLPELEELLFNKKCPLEQWEPLEQLFVERSQIDDLDKSPDNPWPLAGSTRSVPKSFQQTLKISSGNTLVIKRYEFYVSPKK